MFNIFTVEWISLFPWILTVAKSARRQPWNVSIWLTVPMSLQQQQQFAILQTIWHNPIFRIRVLNLKSTNKYHFYRHVLENSFIAVEIPIAYKHTRQQAIWLPLTEKRIRNKSYVQLQTVRFRFSLFKNASQNNWYFLKNDKFHAYHWI